MTTWVCSDCGTTFEEKVSPCTQCAGERLARLEDDVDDQPNMESRADIKWFCTECGAEHVKNSPPCKQCGNMTLKPAKPTPTQSIPDPDNPAEPEPRDITAMKVLSYLLGVPIAIMGCVESLDGVGIGR